MSYALYTLLLFPVERNHYNPHFVLNKINMYLYDRLLESKSLQTMQAKQINGKICVRNAKKNTQIKQIVVGYCF